MSTASQNTDPLGYQFQVIRPHGGRVAGICSHGSSVIRLDRSQERPVPAGAELLDTFLDRFEARPDVAAELPAARKEMAAELEAAGSPVTLKILRQRQGLSQTELATIIGTSQAAVSEYENRQRKPAEDMIRALADALQVDFNTLMQALANG